MTNPASLPTMLKGRFPRAASMPRPSVPSVPRPSLPRPSWAMIGIASVDGYARERIIHGHYARELRERVTDVEARVGNSASQLSVNAQIDRVRQGMREENRTAVNGVIGTLTELDGRVDTIDDELATASGMIDVIDTRQGVVVSDARDADERAQDVAEQVDALDYRLDHDVDEKIGDLVNDAAVNSKAIDDVTETVTSVQAVLSALVTNVQHDRNTAAATTERLDVATERLDELIDVVDKIIDVASAADQELGEGLASLDGELNAAAGTVAAMLGGIAELREKARATDAMVDAIVASVVGLDPTTLREALSVIGPRDNVDDIIADILPRQLGDGE